MHEKTELIRDLNDAFRSGDLTAGQVVITVGVQALGEDAVREICRAVASFDDFTPDNDPHGEHDFGSFHHDSQRIFWKIDYCDKTLKYGSDDPSDPNVTTRVLTIMLAEEY